MKHFLTYLKEIQKAEISWNNTSQNPFRYNNCADSHYWREILFHEELNFIQEYETSLISAYPKALQEICFSYLDWARQLFVQDERGQLHHRHFCIKSVEKEIVTCPFPERTEQLASDFISVQYESIRRICDAILGRDRKLPASPYLWKDKQSCLMELGNAILVCGKVAPVDDKVNKQDWYKALFCFLRLAEPPYIDQTLYKLNNRENPARFLDELLKQYRQYLESDF